MIFDKISHAVDKYRTLILDTERYVWNHPETGYKEFETSKYLEEIFVSLGYDVIKPDGITGFYTVIDTGREGPEVLVLGELDSVICPGHKDANKETGAVHSCGHNAQCAALVGVAAALKEEGVLDGLSGRIRLCAVPAEELLEIEYRLKLREEGKIKYFGGKSEFLSRGCFDGVDMAFMVHTSSCFLAKGGSVGCVAKKIEYKGVAAHAGGSPWLGRNALYAANCGLNAVNAIRETFKDQDLIRVHPIMTSGGAMVNAIPESATLESYVRGKTINAISEANKKVNQSLIGAAISLGTNVDIIDIPGYAPLINDTALVEVAREALSLVAPDEVFAYNDSYSTGSTDMGDLSMIMPVLHPYSAGSKGHSHGSDYEIADPEKACVTTAKWQVAMLRILLSDGAERARSIIDAYTPTFSSKEEFLAYQDSVFSSGDRISYNDEGATVKL